jgi:hypothetical protein
VNKPVFAVPLMNWPPECDRSRGKANAPTTQIPASYTLAGNVSSTRTTTTGSRSRIFPKVSAALAIILLTAAGLSDTANALRKFSDPGAPTATMAALVGAMPE